jgi:MFS family permease
LGWRYCFYINLPLLVLPLYVSTFLLRNYNLDENSGESMYEKIKKIDYAGAFTIVSAVVLFLLATTLGGNIRPWSDPVVVGCLIGSIIFAIAFCLVEAKFSAFPIMPWSIISSQTPFACSMTNLWCVMSSTALIYMTPIFFQVN